MVCFILANNADSYMMFLILWRGLGLICSNYRYQYYLQLKNDIVDGRLPLTVDQVIRLAAFSLQGKNKHLLIAKNSIHILEIYMLFCRLLIFLKNQYIWKFLSGIPSECQTVWIQIRSDILSGLIWVQTVCKDYQQTTLAGKELWLIMTSTHFRCNLKDTDKFWNNPYPITYWLSLR